MVNLTLNNRLGEILENQVQKQGGNKNILCEFSHQFIQFIRICLALDNTNNIRKL